MFLNTSKAFRGSVEIIETAGTGLVQIVESGSLEDARPLLEKYLNPMVEAGVDNIVLGCTHYPFLTPIIKSIVPNNIAIIDSGDAVARRTRHIIESYDLASITPPEHNFYTNGKLEVLKAFAAQLKGSSSPITSTALDF